MSTSDEKRSIAETLLKEAYQHAPDDFITDLMETIDYDNEKHGGIYVSRKIEICWDERLANVLFKKFKEDHLKIKSKVDLLELLLSHNFIEAKRYAESILTASLPGGEEKRKESIKIASTLVLYAEDGSWGTIWSAIKRDTDFGRAVLTEIVEKSDHISENLTKVLSEEQLGDFYLWLVEQYPFHEDPHYDGLHDFDPRYSISFYRNSILDYLKEAGTPEAVKAIQRISLNLPELIQLKWVLYKAQKNAREKTWQPYKAADILKIAESYQKTLVQNGNQLLDVLIESLKRLEQKLHDETPASRDIWDHNPTTNKFRPIDENGFSDYVKRHLDEDLKKRGIVVNREVRIHRGERTDIHVDAVIKGNSEWVYDKINAIIEVKGCWNNELAYAMKTQLVERYLKDNICQHGLYLVGWFYCDLWDDQDSRKQSTLKIVKRKAQIKFDKQSLELSQNNITVKAFIMNTALKR